jgi:hypothetical protein
LKQPTIGDLKMLIHEDFNFINPSQRTVNEINEHAIHLAKRSMKTEGFSPGGILKKITMKDQQIHRAEFAAFVYAVYILSGNMHTTHYWEMEYIKAAQTEIEAGKAAKD